MNVTIKDIAERAGVSFSTVSKALRNSPLVQEKTKRKILDIANDMGYQPNIAARRLVSKKSEAIGVVWPSVEMATPSLLITMINDLLERQGYTTVVSINRIDRAIEAFQRFHVDAILVFYDRARSDMKEEPARANIPIMYYGVAETTTFPTLDVKRGKAIELAIAHLAELGHSDIAYIGDVVTTDLLQVEKINVYHREMKARGWTPRIASLSSMESHEGYLAAKALLVNEQPPTAIISGSYDLTRGILRAASEFNVRVPEQLSIVSYDNIPNMATLEVPVTAVGVPVSDIAKQLADILTSIAKQESEAETCFMEPALVVRNSTCPPKKRE